MIAVIIVFLICFLAIGFGLYVYKFYSELKRSVKILWVAIHWFFIVFFSVLLGEILSVFRTNTGFIILLVATISFMLYLHFKSKIKLVDKWFWLLVILFATAGGFIVYNNGLYYFFAGYIFSFVLVAFAMYRFYRGKLNPNK